MDRLDRFLEIGSGFDWITPAFSLLAGSSGRVVGFNVPAQSWPVVYLTLSRARIPLLNVFHTGGLVMFDVPKDKAILADRLLR